MHLSESYGLGTECGDKLLATWESGGSPDKGNPSLIDLIDASISGRYPQEGSLWLSRHRCGTALPLGGSGLTLSAEMRAWRTVTHSRS
jgi:hypothetical protein